MEGFLKGIQDWWSGKGTSTTNTYATGQSGTVGTDIAETSNGPDSVQGGRKKRRSKTRRSTKKSRKSKPRRK